MFTHVFQIHEKFPLVSPSTNPGQSLATLQSPTSGYPDLVRQLSILHVGIFHTKYDYLFPLSLFIPLFFLPPQKKLQPTLLSPFQE